MVNQTLLFDRSLLRSTQKRIKTNFPKHNFLIKHATNQLIDRLSDIKRNFKTGVVIGASSPLAPTSKTIFYMDETQNSSLAGDEECFPFANASLDLIISIMRLQACNDLPGTLIQMRKALKPDGLFLAVLAGGNTLHELRDCLMRSELKLYGGVSPRVYPFIDKQQAGALLQRAGFALPVVDSENINITYDHLTSLMHDLRYMGGGNILNARKKTFTGKALFKETENLYRQTYSGSDKKLKASAELIYMIGWAPHESQQQPLKPGSAKLRLEDALNKNETSHD